MWCSPAEIERKRLEALQKLSKKCNSPIKAASNTGIDQNVATPAKCSSPFKMRPIQSTSPFKTKPYEKTPSATSTTSVKFNGDLRVYSKTVTVTFSLLSSQRFVVNMSAYSAPVVETIKTVASKSFDPTTREWSFSVKDYKEVLTKLNLLSSANVLVEAMPNFVLTCVTEPDDSEADLDTSQMDPTLIQTLLPFQYEGLKFGVQRKGRCLIADDMGLGKTFQALAIMNYYRKDWPLLIVTTASMKNVWEGTIMKYIPSVSIMQVQYMISSRDFIEDSLVLIVSHDLMSRCCEKLIERKFGCIIIDESHNLKNYKAKMTQAAMKICKVVKRVVLLSGTPVLSRPKELYSQLSLIDEKLFGSFFNYAKRYCALHQTNFGLDSSGKSNLQELEIILKKKFMIRRKKEDVLGCLPNKSEEVIKLNMNLGDLNKADKTVLEQLSNQYVETKKSSDKHSILISFFCETAKIKIPAVCLHIEKVLKEKKKILVFAHHKIMLDAVEELLKFNNYKYIRIDGSSSTTQRKYLIDKFQIDSQYVCAVLSITSTNAGISLTAANQVVFAELHWNPSILKQAEARVHRIGQENAVLIQYLLASGTADDYMWQLLQKKQDILREMGLTKEVFSVAQQKQEKNTGSSRGIFGTISKENNTDSGVDNQAMDEDVLDDDMDDILSNMDI
ncbi:hypothetical protein HUJ04_007664 [Dendroctonus ponderosae]|uniref:SWI/SNF-related matrix-associated actin-dependent regulator of chromatin subfamily A-like protein 1 n=2 Tax=Dendroctonus ponderosae TaxID=77166 RepID=A0AAR5QAR8_DENPD|nr:hypothetical protein HUJ04_007664 [Dendroctonus ponderosae]